MPFSASMLGIPSTRDFKDMSLNNLKICSTDSRDARSANVMFVKIIKLSH
jgi:hypothetical protein